MSITNIEVFHAILTPMSPLSTCAKDEGPISPITYHKGDRFSQGEIN